MKNNYLDVKRTESSPVEPCTLTEAKAQLIITYSEDDTLITSLITKARKAIENYCNISIVSQSVVMTADLYNEWELPYGPVTGITAVQTRSTNEGSGPMTYASVASGWNTDGEEFLSFIPFGSDFWLTKPSAGQNRYRISYTTGYGTVPDDLKQAVLMQLAWFYEHRGEEKEFTVCEAAKQLANPYIRQAWL